MPLPTKVVVGCLSAICIWSSIHSVSANDPLHRQIDQFIAHRAGGSLATRSSDAEFLRRIYLDFVGVIPTAEELREFLGDMSADKRAVVIDRLLADSRYADRMTDLFNIMLIERRSKHEEWLKYLHASFTANKPWDQMAREILAPSADDESTRGAALFYTARLEHYGQNPPDVPGLVRDVGRMFLGVDVQCAQCHDHLFVSDYKQVDYQGLFAFVGTATLRQDLKFPAVGENPLLQKIAFKSVFEGDEMKTGPRVPGGKEIEIPVFPKGEEYVVPPDKKLKTPGVLKFSPMRALAENLPHKENPNFAKNIANRLWWMMMGRGLVDPLDLQHSANPPSHPELLELLALEMTAHGFDIKWMLREMALSETYQRSTLLPDDQADNAPLAAYRAALERPLSPTQLLQSLQRATGQNQAIDKKSYADLRDRFDKAFANPPKEPEVSIAPTVKGALFLSNDELLISWFRGGEGNTVERLSKLADNQAVADEAYVTVLSRLPTDDERVAASAFIDRFAGPRERAISHFVWALASSTEFFVNH